MGNIELLSPAGSMDSLKAAVQNGADAVYLGGSLFGARASARNFDRKELAEAVFYAHLRDVKVYVTVNILLDDSEVTEALEYIDYLYVIGVDGVIVQDIGLAMLIRKYYRDLALHGSTQMTINSLEGAVLLESIGFNRVVLARETDLEEIRLISKYTDLEIEYFGHGALCVAYSGQCLMSSMIGDRSGNRGRCAQPCRHKYTVDSKEGYFLSPKDLCTSDFINELRDAGVDSLKLEGRMKRPDYVAIVTDEYRKLIDKNIPVDRERLAQGFNRGFTKGIGLKSRGEDYASTDRPDNRGVIVGRVLSQERGRTTVVLDRPLNYRDVLEFDTVSGPRTFQSPRDLYPGREEFIVPFDIIIGDVRRIIDIEEQKSALETVESDSRMRAVDIHVEGKIGSPLKITVTDGQVSGTAEGQVVEEGRKYYATKEDITNQVDRLGDTGLILRDLDISIDSKVFLPVSVLNRTRREAVDRYLSTFRSNYERQSKNYTLSTLPSKNRTEDPEIIPSFSTVEQLRSVDWDSFDTVYLRFIDGEIYSQLQKEGKTVYYRPRSILYHQDYEKIKGLLTEVEVQGITIDNLGGIEGFKDYRLVGSTGLNIYNSYSAQFTKDIGLESTILSPELNLERIKGLNTDQNLSLTVYGMIKVMTMEYCPFSTIRKCSDDSMCKNCKYSEYYLTGQNGEKIPVYRSEGYSDLYHPYPLSLIDRLDHIKNVDSYVLDFTIESGDLTSKIWTAYKEKDTSINTVLRREYTDITTGHLDRGIK